jgi:hexosaminidase
MNLNNCSRSGIFFVCVSFLLLSFCQTSKESSDLRSSLNLMPWPAEITVESGQLRLDSGFRIAWQGFREPRLERAMNRFNRRLSDRTGIPTAQGENGMAALRLLEISCKGPGEEVQSLREDESYAVKITASRIALDAPTPVGVLRGLETLLQLVTEDEKGFYLPSLRIQDKPRFPWRGLLIDACRHWMPVEVIKRNLDGMAAVKMNVLHWHLSEDQGFRVECMNFPRLHEMGSDGDYYTQEQVKDIIAYARDRGIRVVPEFDMPGHTTSWLVGYPELASSPGPFAIERHWGVHDPCMDPTREEVYSFLDTFIGEMTRLFPDEYFHIGGDEVNGILWNSNPDIIAFKKAQGMKDNHDLQAYFNKKISAIIQKHGKKMIGWDEIFHPELPKDVVVHSWRGPKSLAETARQGYMGILSNGYYLDHILPAAQHYQVEPLSGDAALLSEEERARILGGEACMWAEFVTPETIDSRIWPRAAAVAERFWSSQDVTDEKDMYRRLAVLNGYLDSLGLQHNTNYPEMLQRLAGEYPIDSLKVLADIVEPVRYYTRPGTREYTQMTPLIRLVDAARPESRQARKFRDMVDRYLADPLVFTTERDTLREWLSKWRDNHEALKPILEESPLLNEIIPLSEDAAALAEAGFQALEYIAEDQEAPLSFVEKVLPLLNPPRKPEHELLIMIAPGVEKLVQKARPPLVTDDFEADDAQGWEPNVPENWQIGGEQGARVYQLIAPGTPGEIRAPASWSLLKGLDVSGFIFTGRLRCASPVDNPHRDMVILFHYQDPTHFYYVHFSAVSDDLHNIIGLVNGADRVRINREAPGGSTARLTDMQFHTFKVSCDGETGEIKAYLDDMQTPILTAQDKTLGHGLVGVGSFDDTGSFDDIQLWCEIQKSEI